MKITYSSNGYIGYEEKIAGYEFRVFQTPSGHISFGAPMGGTPEEKAMFDKLVYYNKNLYNGRTANKEKIKDAIRKFISEERKKYVPVTK